MKKIAAVLLTMIALLSSIALSEEAAPADPSEGSRLIGLLITQEDLSAYAGEDGVLIASCAQQEADADPEYSFGEVDGLRLLCFTVPDETGEGSRIVSNVDDGISAVDFDMSDDGSSVKMDAAISVVQARGMHFSSTIPC